MVNTYKNTDTELKDTVAKYNRPYLAALGDPTLDPKLIDTVAKYLRLSAAVLEMGRRNEMTSLDDWIDGVRTCPDDSVKYDRSPGREISRFTAEFGVYDNWSIYAEGDLEKITGDLINSGKYSTESIETRWELISDPRKSHYQKGPWGSFLGRKIIGIKKRMMKASGEYDKQQIHRLFYNPGTVNLQVFDIPEYTPNPRKYNLKFIFHPSQPHMKGPGKEMPGVSWAKAMSIAILEMMDYLKQNSSAFCINDYVGWNNPSYMKEHKPLVWP
jgi:hypothetical protein